MPVHVFRLAGTKEHLSPSTDGLLVQALVRGDSLRDLRRKGGGGSRVNIQTGGRACGAASRDIRFARVDGLKPVVPHTKPNAIPNYGNASAVGIRNPRLLLSYDNLRTSYVTRQMERCRPATWNAWPASNFELEKGLPLLCGPSGDWNASQLTAPREGYADRLAVYHLNR